MSDAIISYIHCRHCITRGKKPRYDVGLTDPWTLRVWCKTCLSRVGDFTLAEPIIPRCDQCGELITPNHKH